MKAKKIRELLDKFISNKPQTPHEDRLLTDFFNLNIPEDDNWKSRELGDEDTIKDSLFKDVLRDIQERDVQLAREVHVDFRKNRVKTLLKYVAVLTLISSSIFLVLINRNENQVAKIPASKWEIKETKSGERKSFKFSDGTLVKLNASSSIEFPKRFASSKREVILNGEAFFQVARNPSKPFIVHASEVKVEVLGTSFNVKAYQADDEIKVAVESGKVAVNQTLGSSSKIFLLPEEMAMYSKVNKEIKKISFVSEEEVGWKDGIITFEKASEKQVISTLERWYGVEFLVDNECTTPWELTARFENQSLEEVLMSISYTAKFDYIIKSKQVNIKYKKSKKYE